MSGVGGDMSEDVVCPRCGATVCNTRWPRHFRSDECQSDESAVQTDLSGGRAGE